MCVCGEGGGHFKYVCKYVCKCVCVRTRECFFFACMYVCVRVHVCIHPYGWEFFLSLVFVLSTSLSLAGHLGGLTWVRLKQPQKAVLPIPASVCIVFSCVQTNACLPVFGIVNNVHRC